ncbi:MAG: sulfatase-like hydrolase/transferase [Actinomycetota bacterium]|nr:sulfatase-like hydrolase/transferase [Actinomycetota bacterium]
MSVGSTAPSSLWQRLLVVSGLAAAAFVAPVLDIYGRNPEVFVANRTSPLEIVLFGLIVTLIIPFVSLVVLYIEDRIGGRAPTIAYTTLVVVLAVGTGLVVSRQVFTDSSWAALALTAAVAVLVVYLVKRFEPILVWFAIALPLVFVMFIVTSGSAGLIWTGPEASSSAFEIETPAPIVMIQLDEFPTASLMDINGEVNETLFPNFARLANQGTWYRNAIANSIATTQSVPAILTGIAGEKGMSPSSVDYPDNLFTMLGGAYEMHVIEWVADLCPEDICPEYAGRAPARFSSLLGDVAVVYGHLALPPALRENLPSIDNAWKGFLGQDDRPGGSQIEIEGLPVPDDGSRVRWADWIQRIVNGIDAGGPPTFSYAHVPAPHVPWETNPSGTHYERPEEYTEVEGVEGNGRWGPAESPTLLGFQRHLYQLGFLDAMIGRIFDKLDSTGTWDETMIVIVADHGASFVPGEHRRWPYENNRADLYRVPMFVKYPGQQIGSTEDTPTYGFDLVPTIVDVLGIDTDWEFDGLSLASINGIERPHEPIWWCCNGDGVSTDLSALMDQVEANFARIPDQGSWLSVAGVGPHGGLVGQPVTSLGVTQVNDLRWSLDRGADLAEADIESGRVQTLWTGRIELPPGSDAEDVVFVVNGNIGGVGYITRDSPTGGIFRGLIAEELVVDGRNDLDILIPDGSGEWLSGSADVLRLELLTPDGRVLDIQAEGSRRVQVDKVTSSTAGWFVEGWSADVTRKETPDIIYVFAGDVLVAHGPPNTDNENVVNWFDSEDLLRSGFVFEVAASDVPDGVDQLTVVAEFGTYAVADPARLTTN